MVKKKQAVLVLVTVMATIGLIGHVVAGIPAYADESETNTDQVIKQKNVCSGFAICTNIANNLIESTMLR